MRRRWYDFIAQKIPDKFLRVSKGVALAELEMAERTVLPVYIFLDA